MKHKKLATALAFLCVLAGSALAVEKLTQAVVNNEKCLGCGSCVEECPQRAITQGDDGIAKVDKEKCTGCNKCVKACPIEAIKVE